KTPSITPTDCNTIETNAGVALDMVNRHRRGGYVFSFFCTSCIQTLFYLHFQGNSLVLYLSLDVLETECSVLSKRHWESCEYSDIYSMASNGTQAEPNDFGQRKIITYISQLLKKPQQYGFNCTLSPGKITTCKDCPMKIEVLEVTKQHKNFAAKALGKCNRESNHTNYFDMDKVEKILK
ncbi:HRG protein, partial [Herpetotheres cachinnans]|nr:HRG protein [Herpetotheres cachinnans]